MRAALTLERLHYLGGCELPLLSQATQGTYRNIQAVCEGLG